jgi:cysteine desulfurase / selenocysteine lyase
MLESLSSSSRWSRFGKKIDERFPLSLDLFKSAFTNPKGFIHMNNAGLSPVSRPAVETACFWLERLQHEGMHANDAYLEALLKSRSTFGKLLGCTPEEIAFFQSTSGAISQVAFGLKLSPQDEILTWEGEYSSLFYPLQEAARRSGAKLVEARRGPDFSTPVEHLIESITPRTKVIAISWVQFVHGSRTDLKSLMTFLKGKEILTVIDAIQGVGIHPMGMEDLGIDVLCLGSHKWLAGPVGVGILAIKKERIASLSPIMVGAHTYGTCDDPVSALCRAKKDASCFESGSRQVIDILALEASIQLFLETGINEIETEAQRLSRLLRRGLQQLGYQVHCPNSEFSPGAIVNFTAVSQAQGLKLAQKHLQENKISFAIRGDGLRLSPHAFNTDREIHRVLDVLSLNAGGVLMQGTIQGTES